MIVDNPLIHQLSHEKIISIISITGVVSSPSKKGLDQDLHVTSRHVTLRRNATQDFVGDSRPPSALFWSDVLDTAKGRAKRATETSLEAERKRFRRKHEIMAFFHGKMGGFMNELC